MDIIALMNILLSLIVPIISFIFQFYPRIFNKHFGVDVWTRLLETDHVRKNGHRIPDHKLSEQFIVDGYFDYPPLFPWLLSFVPKKILTDLQGAVSPFFDSLQVLLVFWTAWYFTNNLMLAILAQVIYMLTPMIALENSYLTPRSFGYLNFSLAVLPLLIYNFNHQLPFYFVGVLFATFLFMSHRFAIQSFFFLTIFFSFFLNSAVFFQAFVLGFVGAMILTRGYYLRVLKGHLYNIYFWTQNLEFRFAHQVRGVIKKDTKTDWVGKVYSFLSVFSPIAIFGLNPWAASAFVYFFFVYMKWSVPNPITTAMAAWVLFFYFLGVVVLKTKRLMPIGEGQRYMEMATVPSSLLSAALFFYLYNSEFQLYAVVALSLLLAFNLVLIIFVQVQGVIKDRNRSITGDLAKVFAYIDKQKKQLRIICVPHQNTTMTVYNTKAAVFVNADNPGLMRIQEVYPILRVPLKELAKKYKLTHALIKTGFATMKELKLSQKQVVFESGDVKLVRL
jgi:hypothetical protein